MTAAALALFIISALAQSLILLFVRGYYAAGETKKPLMINTLFSFVTIGTSFFLVYWYRTHESVRLFFEDFLRVEGGLPSTILMLPLAFSIGITLNALFIWISFERSFSGFSKVLWRPFWQSTAASLIAGYVSYIFLEVFDDIFDLETLVGVFSQGFLAGIIGILAGLLALIIFKNPEIKEVWRTLHHRIWGVKAITTGQEEL